MGGIEKAYFLLIFDNVTAKFSFILPDNINIAIKKRNFSMMDPDLFFKCRSEPIRILIRNPAQDQYADPNLWQCGS